MNKLKVDLQHCWGIQSLSKEFEYASAENNGKAYAIYAPNGLMKTSFTKTFEALSKGDQPKEERHNRVSSCVVKIDGNVIPKEMIYVLKSEIDISTDSPAITNILVDPANKARYDELLIDLDRLKSKLINSLQRSSKVPKNNIERTILNDWSQTDFPTCVAEISEIPINEDLSPYEYATIFDPKVVEILKSQEFISKAEEFNKRYQELFEQTGTIYKKGIFNPTKAENSFSTLDKQGFFASGHRVHLSGEEASIDKAELDQKLQAIHASIDGDAELKKLRTNLAQNAQTQALNELIENLSSTQVELLLEKLKPANQQQFKKELWGYYIHNKDEAKAYLSAFESSKAEMLAIEAAAAKAAPSWIEAVERFNDRFVDMPFTLSIANQKKAALGIEQAKLKFSFDDGAGSIKECYRDEVKLTLSQGEKRALYLLNFIFEVEERKLANQETLFIIDDVADSFDYKNKHAIIQYLGDLSTTTNFYQIILTHNFDFFRALANSHFVAYKRCLMANKNNAAITLTNAKGINNYFIGEWKNKVTIDDRILCATIPFTRNLIEYTRGVDNQDYKTLTSLLHWKNDTDQITIGQYLDIYNRLFNESYDTSNTTPVKILLFTKAHEICSAKSHDGLNLEDKVLLSIAIRIQAEIFLTNELRTLKGDANYWCPTTSQFGNLMKELSLLDPTSSAKRTLEKVSVTVSSNIHLNSFMYEPILDLTIEHLIDLHNKVRAL